MSVPPNPRFNFKRDLLFLLPCLTVALLIRLLFFNGLSLHDDVNYWLQAVATGVDNVWPPLKTHWHTRIGFILPCALLLKIFGLKIWVPYLFTMLGGLLEIAATFYIARNYVSESTARLAAWLCVFFPLNILYSSYLYVDLWAGLLGAVSLFLWHRALFTDEARKYALASLFFGLAWLFRETIVMLGPIYLALWLQAGRWRRPKLIWALPPGLIVLAGEMLLYQVTAGNWHYRLDSILGSKNELLESFADERSFLLTPIVQLFTSHEFGLFLLTGLVVTIATYRHLPTAPVLWLWVGFVWLSWGTTVPSFGWVTLQRNPRYLSVLAIPCLMLLAAWVLQLRSGLWRGVAMAALIASGVLGASLDVGRAKSSVCRKFALSEYNRSTTTLEPFVYFGVRAAQNFSLDGAQFACASDLGRQGAVKLIPRLPGARLMKCSEARYLILSAQEQPEKWRNKINEGWRKVAEYSSDIVVAREVAGRLLAKCSGRAVKTSATPGLLVLENPAFTNQPDATLQGH